MNPAEEWHLEGQHVGRRVLVYERVDSTNALALAMARDSATDGLVLVAQEQTAGRGQHGRTWLSPAGSSVLLSAIVFPPPPLQRPVILTAWAAVSVCEAIREAIGLRAAIKWPNDVLLDGRKVCGILIEQRGGTVVGIGLNVNQTAEAFCATGLLEATSLAACVGQPFACEEMTRLLLRRLDTEYRRLLGGEVGLLEACWRERLGLLGRLVTAECHEGEVRGRLLELSFAGVVLELPGGTVRQFAPETIRHLRPVSAREAGR